MRELQIRSETELPRSNLSREVAAGGIVIVPAGLPHRFWSSGDGPLRQVDIHLSERFATEWL